jgi:Fic family protein
MQMRTEDSARILELGKRAKKAGLLIEYLYRDPIVSVSDVARLLKVTPQTANALVRELVRLGILREITGFDRNRLFAYDKYLQLFSDTE